MDVLVRCRCPAGRRTFQRFAAMSVGAPMSLPCPGRTTFNVSRRRGGDETASGGDLGLTRCQRGRLASFPRGSRQPSIAARPGPALATKDRPRHSWFRPVRACGGPLDRAGEMGARRAPESGSGGGERGAPIVSPGLRRSVSRSASYDPGLDRVPDIVWLYVVGPVISPLTSNSPSAPAKRPVPPATTAVSA